MDHSTQRPEDEIPSEQTFFKDAAIDRLVGMVFSLAAELQVLRDRVAVAELLLAHKGLVSRTEFDEFRPNSVDEAVLVADSRSFTAEILKPLLGRQASRSEGGQHVI